MTDSSKIQLFTRINSITRKEDRILLQMDLVQKALNCRGDKFIRLPCTELFDPKSQNHYVQTTIAKNIHQKLLSQRNVFLFTYGVSGAGKTHSLFGSDVKQNEIGDKSAFLTTLFKKLKDDEKQYDFKISFGEIIYENEREVMVDLLSQKTCSSVNQLNSAEFSDEEKLNKLFLQAIEKSQNFIIKSQDQIRFNNNEAHFIVQLQMIHPQSHLVQTFTLVDLIGFSSSSYDPAQKALNNLTPYFEPDSNIGQSHLQNLFRSQLHSSDTMCLFTPTESKSFEFIIELVQNFLQHTYELDKSQQFFNSQKQSYNTQSKKQIQQQINQQIHQQQRDWNAFQNMSQSIMSQEESQNQDNVERFWQNQQDQDEDEEQQEEQPSSMHIQQEKPADYQSHLMDIRNQMNNLNDKLNYSYDFESESSVNEEVLQQTVKQNFVYTNDKNSKDSQNIKNSNVKYENKVDECLEKMDYPQQESDPSPQYLILKRNYDILLGLFRESEAMRKNQSSEIQILKNDLAQLAAQNDIRLQNEKIKIIELKKKIRFIQDNSDENKLHEFYETQINKLQKEKQYVIQENNKILGEMGKTFENDSERDTQIYNFSSLRNQLLKRNDQLTKFLKIKDEEVSNLQQQINKQERNAQYQEMINPKIITLQKQLKKKQNQERQLTEINESLEQTLSKNKEDFFKLQKENQFLNKEYEKLQEQLMLYKELAVIYLSQDENVKIQKEHRVFEEQKKSQGQTDIRKRKQQIFQQLKSIMD